MVTSIVSPLRAQHCLSFLLKNTLVQLEDSTKLEEMAASVHHALRDVVVDPRALQCAGRVLLSLLLVSAQVGVFFVHKSFSRSACTCHADP